MNIKVKCNHTYRPKTQMANRDEFFKSTTSKFMPVEHFGMNPHQIMMLDKNDAKPESESPLYKQMKIPDPPALGDDDAFEILNNIDDLTKQKKLFEGQRVDNEKFVKSIFNKTQIGKEKVKMIIGNAFVRQYA